MFMAPSLRDLHRDLCHRKECGGYFFSLVSLCLAPKCCQKGSVHPNYIAFMVAFFYIVKLLLCRKDAGIHLGNRRRHKCPSRTSRMSGAWDMYDFFHMGRDRLRMLCYLGINVKACLWFNCMICLYDCQDAFGEMHKRELPLAILRRSLTTAESLILSSLN